MRDNTLSEFDGRKSGFGLSRFENAVSIGLVVIAAFIYLQTAQFDFVNMDDDKYVFANPHIADGFTWSGIKWAFTAELTSPSAHADYWQPVTFISRMIDMELFGPYAGGHHLVNATLHALNAILLFIVLSRTTMRPLRAAVAAGLFAAHPIHVESVAWVVERKDLLSFFFAFFSIGAYAIFRETGRRNCYLFSVGAFAAGLMSKPMVVTLPFVLIMFNVWPLGKLRVDRKDAANFARILIQLAPYFLMTSAMIVIASLTQSEEWTRTHDVSRLVTVPVTYLKYLRRLFFPSDLAVYYPLEQTSAAYAALLWAGIIAFSALTFFHIRRRPYAAFGWLWFLGTMVPVIGYMRFVGVDHYAYFPFVGLYILVVWSSADFADLIGISRQWAIAVAITAICALAVTSFNQAGHWKNSKTILGQTLQVTKNNYFAHRNLGVYYAVRGDQAKAIEHLTASIKAKPDYAEGHFNLGYAYQSWGSPDAAVFHYKEAVRHVPNYQDALFNAAAVRESQGLLDEAETLYRKELEISPKSAHVHNNFAILLTKTDRFGEALLHLSQAVNLEPGEPLYRAHRAIVLNALGRLEEALSDINEAFRRDPGNAFILSTKRDIEKSIPIK